MCISDRIKAKRIRVDGEGVNQTVRMLERSKAPADADAAPVTES